MNETKRNLLGQLTMSKQLGVFNAPGAGEGGANDLLPGLLRGLL